ncbi:hypothetical protein B0I35DRAFT_443692 [Stachybotrys elegans]|uniref:Uncharacterized protein n=1 Tax=Stachybotrys elegans TaxID=80388 RepID=A0A8K0SK64_9HYPO|nr:hypothetical protein B0I35DRAFT_443692 [Stachybotrys elegans]
MCKFGQQARAIIIHSASDSIRWATSIMAGCGGCGSLNICNPCGCNSVPSLGITTH